MDTIIFDGKKFANEREKALKERVSALKIKPKLVAVLVGNDRASIVYTNLKKKAAERIGIKFEIKKYPSTILHTKLITEINKLNKDKKVQGIMVQLPLPTSLKAKTKTILNTIDKNKDIDGLRTVSKFTPAAVKAVIQILDNATKDLAYFGKKASVVGASGQIGKAVVKELQKKGYKVCECDKDTRDLYAKLHEADLVVSATGAENLVKGEMIKEGVIAIDVGAPVGDFDFKSMSLRAGFITPVPGGVGPVTVVSLLENLIDSAED